MEVVKKVLASSSFWAAVLTGLVNGLHAAGVIGEAQANWFNTAVVPYIVFRITGDTAKAVRNRGKS